jgi:trimeric autotransporter adhesin
MRALLSKALAVLFFAFLSFNCHAQSGIITTYVGLGLPVNDASATTQDIGEPKAVASDGNGGFYFSNSHRIYHVAADGRIDLFAGSDANAHNGDGNKATALKLYDPTGLAVDSTGNLYIVEYEKPRIRKATPEGVITTIAGNGKEGYSGDGGKASKAQFKYPTNAVVDSAGNLYIADTGNHRIRKITPDGMITTVAGNGKRGYSGDGGKATSAQLDWPRGLAVDSAGNLFIADMWNFCIRKVSSSGIITTFVRNRKTEDSGDAGKALSARFLKPVGLALDSSGNLYISTEHHRIYKVTPFGIITTVVGTGKEGYSGDGGQASFAQLNSPNKVAVDSAGNLYIADADNHRIRKVAPDGVITTVAGNGTSGYGGDGGQASFAQLNSPNNAAVDSAGNLYIADADNHRIRKVAPDGVIITFAGDGNKGHSGDGGQAASARINRPTAVAVDSSGNLFIADTENHRIREVATDGVITTVAGNGKSGFSGDGGLAISAQLDRPDGVAVDAAGNLYITDMGNARIRKVSPAGVITTVAGGDWVLGSTIGDGGPATSARLWRPVGIAVDSAGNLYIADTQHNRIRKVTPAGIITTVAGNGGGNYSGNGRKATKVGLSFPAGVAVDAADNLYITARFNDSVRKVTPEGLITTIAGNGERGYGGDGGKAVSAQLYDPMGVAVDSSGNIYIADTGNHRIRKVTPSTR